MVCIASQPSDGDNFYTTNISSSVSEGDPTANASRSSREAAAGTNDNE